MIINVYTFFGRICNTTCEWMFCDKRPIPLEIVGSWINEAWEDLKSGFVYSQLKTREIQSPCPWQSKVSGKASQVQQQYLKEHKTAGSIEILLMSRQDNGFPLTLLVGRRTTWFDTSAQCEVI